MAEWELEAGGPKTEGGMKLVPGNLEQPVTEEGEEAALGVGGRKGAVG